jgi:adenylosuccinate lyase
MDNISPIDGRYHNITKSLSSYFSEFSFMKYRLYVELQYFIHLIDVLPELKSIASPSIKSIIINIWKIFDKDDFNIIKQYEIILNHDIKALEYFIRDKFKTIGLEKYTSFIHFGITSQDINTSANILALKESLFSCIIPNISKIVSNINYFIQNLGSFSTMLGFTHGQPAVPTTMSKEFHVFVYRINEQLKILNTMPFTTKFGGAVGNFNAHYAAYPEINWTDFANNFIRNIGLQREQFTTQISNYDHLCNMLNVIKTINNIINDLNIDCWLYISKGYLKLKSVSTEVGSSTMPQKVNPINFENSEGNICIANAMLEGVTRKISISRLQRDLTDSTILRNLGSIMAYSLIAYTSTQKGIGKIEINHEIIKKELHENLSVLSEGIQTILRKHNVSDAYEQLHELTRDKPLNTITLNIFISTLPQRVRIEVEQLTLDNYTGYT